MLLILIHYNKTNHGNCNRTEFRIIVMYYYYDYFIIIIIFLLIMCDGYTRLNFPYH